MSPPRIFFKTYKHKAIAHKDRTLDERTAQSEQLEQLHLFNLCFLVFCDTKNDSDMGASGQEKPSGKFPGKEIYNKYEQITGKMLCSMKKATIIYHGFYIYTL